MGPGTLRGPSSLADWVAGHCPWLPAAEVAQVVAVVGAAQQPRNTPLAQAVTAGRVPVRRAARLVRALERVAPFVTEQEYRGYQQIGLPLAALRDR